jgi:uncharacterized membrane protein
MPTKETTKNTFEKALPWILLISGIIGLICSAVISYDKYQLLQNPHFVPNCDLNPIISCGSVMASSQGSVFGFPNPWIGLAAFSVLITVGAALLARATFKRWFWIGLQIGMVLGMAFAYWLLFESVYRINALCPYCLTVDVVVTTAFWYVTLYNLRAGHIKLPKRLIGVGSFARQHHLDILILWFLIVIAIILKHFWYYYGTYL